MSPVSVEQVAESMFKLVKDAYGKKSLKAMDLIKAMAEQYGEECTKDLCKLAIRQLMDSGRCVYSYFGGSYITLPPEDAEK